jgi:hypothetical protein
MIEHRLSLSAPQIRKLKSGGAITIKPSQFGADSAHSVMVRPQTARRMATAMRKQKGLRISLKPDEDLLQETQGGKISLKSIGKTLGKTARDTGSVLKKTFASDDAMKTYRQLGHYGLDVGVPILAGVAGEMLGGPAGAAAGAALGEIAADQIGKRTGYSQGKGFYKALKKYTGINKTDVKKTAKSMARVGAEVAGEAITAYTGNPMAGKAFEKVASKTAEAAIDGGVKKGVKASKKVVKDMAAEAVDDYIDKNLTGAEKKVAEKALAGKYPSAKELVYDYGNSKLEKSLSGVETLSGYGMLPRRTRGGLRIMGSGTASFTPAYEVAMRSMKMGAGNGMPVDDGRTVTPAEPPSSVIQTGSPFQRFSSPSMSPFITGSPQLMKPIMGSGIKSCRCDAKGCRCGGSFLPAGTRGGSFVPAGV